AGPPPARYDPAYYDPQGALRDRLAAVSVGVIDGEIRLDLDYADDARAEVDMNIALTGAGKFVEIQSSAEACEGFEWGELTRMVDLSRVVCERIMEITVKARRHGDSTQHGPWAPAVLPSCGCDITLWPAQLPCLSAASPFSCCRRQ